MYLENSIAKRWMLLTPLPL